jgi:hypothetical protein
VNEDEAFALPEDLTGLSHGELTALETQALAEFDALASDENITDAGLTRLNNLADAVEAVRAQINARAERSIAAAEAKSRVKAALKASTEVPEPAPAEPAEDEVEEEEATEPAPAPAEPAPAAPVSATTKPRPSLAKAQAAAPALPAEADRGVNVTAVNATLGRPGGYKFANVDELVDSIQASASGMTVTHGTPSLTTVARITNEYSETIDGERTSVREFEELVASIRTPDALDAIVAGGGWCAPSEVKYNFFNISCQDGGVDLPTVGIKRGGIRIPVSPSLADVFTGTFNNTTNPWLWTEADDILTVTGSPNKPCVRVPCATHTETRLECYGICLTAGNLTDSAWPEATRNYLSLLMSAHFHAMNARFITQMVTLSSAINVISSGSGQAISADLPDYVALAANDYRIRYGMCDDDVLEVLLPVWIKDAMRSDFSRRTGVEPGAISDADIVALFRVRRVRIQFVQDWQVRSAGQPGGSSILTAWPDTVDFLIYAAGTFIKGNGLSLDLGVVRDSVLNAENDFTAAWTEECHLIAKVGYESRQYRIPVCIAGRTGSANITDCHVA